MFRVRRPYPRGWWVSSHSRLLAVPATPDIATIKPTYHKASNSASRLNSGAPHSAATAPKLVGVAPLTISVGGHQQGHIGFGKRCQDRHFRAQIGLLQNHCVPPVVASAQYR